ncbi:transcriptional regulator [Gigaspora margarita]|uniref:Transcriptional regulator n=1 Tax=Gigaspora margarita TaxID=4874 RepID=A0A8H4ANS7_GIGMA|nr:transcriptional regulator [Gigaspora margarita]
MSSKITQVFRRSVFPTHFAAHRAQLPKPYLPLSKTLKSWTDLNKLLRKQLEQLHKYQYYDLGYEGRKRYYDAPKDKKLWTVNSAIRNKVRNDVYFVDLEETNVPLLDMILRGDFVALYGARASGKSTRVFQVMEKLKSQGIVCIYVSFESINMKTDTFWSALGVELHINAPRHFKLDDIKSADDFKLKFRKEQWNDKQIVLFIDEFDEFILHLSSDRITTSPFNVRDPFRNPNFTLEQVQTVYKEFENDSKLTIDPEIIEDIFNRTNGHASLVCLCGKTIHSYLMPKLSGSRRLGFSTWLNFVIDFMQDTIADYTTFRRMINSLKKEATGPTIELLRSVFLGSFNFVPIYNPEEKRLAEFLTAEGVLIRDEMKKNNFRISSIFVDELIRRQVIPVLYKSAPTCAVPKKLDGTLDIISTLKIAVQHFDKEIIRRAFDRSFKTAHMYVKGQEDVLVPRESVYDTELNRILVNWIAKQIGSEVTGQWHIVEPFANQKNKHAYSDIVIKTPKQTIILELLATATKKELDKHAVKVLDYAEKLSANEMWIVHFTCEDYTTPYWPSDRKFEKINVVHFFHDRMLKNIQMNVRSISTPGTFKYLDDVILLQ